jgi:hypothetical protein
MLLNLKHSFFLQIISNNLNSTNNMNNNPNNENNNNNINMETNQNIALFLQLLSNLTILQQTLAVATQNSQLFTALTSSESAQTLPAPSSAIVGVVNTSVSILLFNFFLKKK